MAVGRKTGGRQKGTPNKATADIKALAQEHTPAAMERLVKIATKSRSDAAAVAAIREIFDRGFGKAKQPVVGGDPGDAPVMTEMTIRFVDADQDANGA